MARRLVPLLLAGLLACAAAAPAAAPARSSSLADRIDRVQQRLAALTEDVDDLREPVAQLDLFDQCMFTLGVSQHGARGGSVGYLFGTRRWPALSLDLDGVGTPTYAFLAFPQEEPPSIECNEDAEPERADG